MFKRRAIKRYLTVLPRQLLADYGHTGPFTAAQILAAIARHKGLSSRHSAYALAIFGDPAETGHEESREAKQRRIELRKEVGRMYFDSAGLYSTGDVMRFSHDHGWSGPDHGHSYGGGDAGGAHH